MADAVPWGATAKLGRDRVAGHVNGEMTMGGGKSEKTDQPPRRL